MVARQKEAPPVIPSGALSSGGIALWTRQRLNWHCRGGVALTPIKFSRKLWAYNNSVVHSDDTGCQPGSASRLLSFRPGSHYAFEDNLATVRLDCDMVGVEQRAAPERFLDLLLDLLRSWLFPRL